MLSKLASLLEPSSRIPTDVTFEVRDEDDTVHVFKAHKCYLALASDVFEAKFFGQMKETKETVVLNETTSQAFGTMINFIYHKDLRWEDKTVEDLFEIGSLANYYDVAGMMNKVMEIVGEVPITLENVVYLAYIAEQFSMSGDVSQILLDSCASFLSKTLRSHVLDFSGLFSAQHASTALRLHNMILEIPMAYCTNCRQFLCQNRKPVPQDVHLGCTVRHSVSHPHREWKVTGSDGEGHVSIKKVAGMGTRENIIAVSELSYCCNRHLLTVVGLDSSKSFYVKGTTKIGKLQKSYSEMIGVSITSLRFLYDGHRIHDDDTPNALGMKQEDVISVYLEQP